MCPGEQLQEDQSQGEGGPEPRAGSDISLQSRGGNETSWLLPPAPFPWGSSSKAATDPLLQEWGWGGWREVHWLHTSLLLELSLLLSNPRL